MPAYHSLGILPSRPSAMTAIGPFLLLQTGTLSYFPDPDPRDDKNKIISLTKYSSSRFIHLLFYLLPQMHLALSVAVFH